MQSPEPQTISDKTVALFIAEPGFVSDHVTSALANAKDIDAEGPFEHVSEGVSKLRKQHIDVIIIDIGLTKEDALIGIHRMLNIDKKAKIIMASTLTFANVKKSMEGLEKGAADFIEVPSQFKINTSHTQFEKDLLHAVRSLGKARRDDGIREIDDQSSQKNQQTGPTSLRAFQNIKPDIIAIGSSTGGPQALLEVLVNLDPQFNVPILITQHMPKNFTPILTQNLNQRLDINVVEAKHGDLIFPGKIYIAPGDYHMTVEKVDDQNRIRLNQDPPVNYCRPSVDPMFESIAKAYGPKVCGVILTGMGSDGETGSKHIIDEGGQIIAQDFSSSVVWGMPGAVSKAGYCSKVLPLNEIAPLLNMLLNK